MLLTSTVVEAKKPDTSATAIAINNACTTEAATAGCGSEVVGMGLLKCIYSYKKLHRNFQFSNGCRQAIKMNRKTKVRQ